MAGHPRSVSRLLLWAMPLLAFMGLGAPGAALAACKLHPLIELPVTMVGTRPTVPVKINGHEEQMLLDSGAFFSAMAPEVAAKFGVHGYYLPGQRVQGIGGSRELEGATVDEFTLAGVTLKHMPFTIIEGVGAGIIGENVLGRFDVEYDLANGVVRLFKPDGCGSRDDLAYWSKTTAPVVLPIWDTPDLNRHIVAAAQVDGRQIHVMFDTGAYRSILTLAAAARAGVTPQTPGTTAGGRTGGIGPRKVETWIAPFDSLKLGDEQIQHTHLRIGAVELQDTDMLLGADFFLSHRIYVSNSQHKVYFTYNGGPVFNLDRLPDAQTQVADDGAPAAPAEGAPAAPAAPADLNTPTDAPGFARRAAAKLARQDLAGALEDYSRSIALDPANPKTLVDRARAYLANKQPFPAMADFDKAIQIKPDDADALVGRARLLLSSKDKNRARDDLLAAAKVSLDDAQRSLTIANLLEGQGFFQDALDQYDRWLAANPKAEPDPRAVALNGGCWTRAVLGVQLDQALMDCDAALKLKPRIAAFLDSRGRVRLDRGETDLAIADFSAALKENPRLAMSLYSRGVAELRKGQPEHGQADLKAAAAINPRIAQQALNVKLEAPGAAAQATGGGEGQSAALQAPSPKP